MIFFKNQWCNTINEIIVKTLNTVYYSWNRFPPVLSTVYYITSKPNFQSKSTSTTPCQNICKEQRNVTKFDKPILVHNNTCKYLLVEYGTTIKHFSILLKRDNISDKLRFFQFKTVLLVWFFTALALAKVHHYTHFQLSSFKAIHCFMHFENPFYLWQLRRNRRKLGKLNLL